MAVRMIDACRWLADPYGWLDAAMSRHGLTFRARLPTHGECLVTGDPELIAEIVRHPDLDGGKGISALREAFGGDSLITLDGEAHRERRRLIAPGLREPHVARHDGLTVDATREVLGELADGTTFSAYEVVRRISLRVIVRVIFGAALTPPSSHSPARPQAERAAEAESLVEAFLGSFSSPLVLFLRGLHVRCGPWGRAMRNRERLERFLRDRIRIHRAAGAGTRDGDGGLLDHLLRRAPELSDDTVAAEILALLLFGHDTGAATLAWALAHLSEQPDALARIRDEAVGIEARHGRLRPEEHRFLESCLLESMRLCPVVVHLTRVARRDLALGDHRLAAGRRVLPTAYLAQRNPAVFADPGRFDPERFLASPPPRHAYFPFGFGTRTCVGQPLVRRQMILVVSTLARTFELAPAPGYRCRPQRHLVLVLPKDGALLTVRRR